jgi:bidirectional [NiFe] hydrogenase diaphorase subunit
MPERYTNMVQFSVDNRVIEAPRGQSLLQACLQNDIYIPHLCYRENHSEAAASCRLCFVEIEGRPGPVTACTMNVAAGLRVTTDTPAVRRLQRSALKMLLSVHHVDCKHCHANKACSLQTIAKYLKVGLNPKPLDRMLKTVEVDQSHPLIDHYPNRCVLCGLCVEACRTSGDLPVFTFSGRGFNTVLRYHAAVSNGPPGCSDCRACIRVCPVGALQLRLAEEKSSSA